MKTDPEQWRPVVGFEGLYEVSDQGRLRRVGSSSGTSVGRIKQPVIASNGYLRTCIFKNSCGKGVFIHRLVAAAFIGERPDGMQVNHKNGNKQDNRLENLEYVTVSDNALHSRRVLGRGPNKKGSKHHLAKWSEAEILAMRQLLASGLSQADVIRAFGISSASISRIANRVRWTHI